VPEAPTLNVATCPAIAVWFVGCVVICGGEPTVNVAPLLVTLPAVLLTMTEKLDPLSEAVAGEVV
jgi:hypothetical protein